ncbi:MAG: DUF5110 domain-containing protein [Bacteroidales bacterium]|nr:DUF5110 domain-containing protein [Bacteroidales bacterium]
MKRLFPFLTVLALACACSNYSIHGNRIDVRTGAGRISLQVVGSNIIRVQSGHERAGGSLVVLPGQESAPFEITGNSSGVIVRTAELCARVSPEGVISFYGKDGSELLGGGRISLTDKKVEGRKGYEVRTTFSSPSDEAFYGLGQHQTGEFNRKGTDEELYQYNTKISVPFVVSTRGYGLLFDAYSYSRWGNPAAGLQLAESFTLFDKDGQEGALTGTYTAADGTVLTRRESEIRFDDEFAIRNLPEFNLEGATVVYEGWIEAPGSGDYRFSQYYAGFQRTLIGGKELMSRRWRPAWNPNSYRYTAHLEQGVRTPIRIEWEPDGGVSYIGLKVLPLQTEKELGQLSFWSEFEPGADFYFIAGDSFDNVIAGYRTLTGKAQVLPKWALGFWQSRERYSTQDEIVNTLAEFRRRGIPVDNIVQDWQYWLPDDWGSHDFDPARYPDPEKMLDDVHAMNGRFMISVWPKFYTSTQNYKELEAAGYVYRHAVEDSLRDWLGYHQTFYDAYASGGRQLFWKQMDEHLYSRLGRKIDAWWMDASEPNLRDCLPKEYMQWLLTPTALGPATEYYNTYALVNAQAIYEGQRSVEPDKRVFLLTRNGFAGLQRYSTASWSGDTGTSWEDMRTQITAGLGYSMSGLPFWGMDIGGFSVMSKFHDPAYQDEWRELQTRWHQFGAFVPLFRTHGQWPRRELWNIAPEGTPTYESILYYIKLRYRLMPYVYSLAGAVHFDDYTIMRGLPMDFPGDTAAREVSDQWMFGPALMPCPVCEYGARSREVYFPDGVWYDFYTGAAVSGGRAASVSAPYERIPLYVRAGSILPVGPDIQWSGDKAGAPIELRVYPGADGSFVLYEDDGLSYAYERGEYSRVPLHWDDAARTLTVGAREGSFAGTQRFSVCINGSRPVEVNYDGSKLQVKL